MSSLYNPSRLVPATNTYEMGRFDTAPRPAGVVVVDRFVPPSMPEAWNYIPAPAPAQISMRDRFSAVAYVTESIKAQIGSPLTMSTAHGGTAAGIVLGVLIGGRVGANAVEENNNGQTVQVFSRPNAQKLEWEIPLGVSLLLMGVTVGLIRSYSNRRTARKHFDNEHAQLMALKGGLKQVLREGDLSSSDRMDAKNLLRDTRGALDRFGWTPGADARDILKGVVFAVPFTVIALGVSAGVVICCVLAACGDGGGGGGDMGCGGTSCYEPFGVQGGGCGDGSCNSCASHEEEKKQPTANWWKLQQKPHPNNFIYAAAAQQV